MSYLDPGTGSFVAQWLVAVLLGLIFRVRSRIKRVADLMSRAWRGGRKSGPRRRDHGGERAQ